MVKLLNQEVGPVGYGLMGMTWREEAVKSEQAFKAMRAAVANGAVFWNGGVFYATPQGYNSNSLLKEYFTAHPEDADKVILSIKGGTKKGQMVWDGSEENIFRCIEETNAQLGGTKKVDIFEMARVDQNTPIEHTMRAFQKKIDAGELRGVTLSEAGPDTIRRASKVIPVQGVEVEFSLFETSILDNDVARACKESNVPIIAYSPLGRGFLTGQLKSRDDIPKGDLRAHLPRFQPGNFEENLKLAEHVAEIAKQKAVSPAQVALGWVIGMGRRADMPPVIPIPGATTAERVNENTKPAELSDQEVEELLQFSRNAEVKGERYPEHTQKMSFGETPKET